jgi:hypothetical protein
MLQCAGRQKHFEVLYEEKMGGTAEIDTAHGGGEQAGRASKLK